MRAHLRRLRAPFAARPRQTDALVAALVLAATVVSSRSLVDLFRAGNPDYSYEATKDLIGLVLTTLPLALRRTAPLTGLLASCIGFVLARQVFGSMESNMVTFVLAAAFYSAAAHGGERATRPVGVIQLVAAGVLVLGEIAYELADPENLPGAGAVFIVFAFAYNLALIVAMWVVGRLRADAVRRNVELAARSRELVAEREQNARRAVLDERVRIARELHDVVAHHVSVIGVQAGAARTVLSRDPERAAQVLASIEGESRQAVAELHRLLGVLRQQDDPSGLAPQPGLAQLGTLASAVEQSGIAVDLEIEGDAAPVPATIDVSAYRIVQESLTNAIKHSGGSRASVRVRYRDGGVELLIQDDGRHANGRAGAGQRETHADDAGLGLVGMRERVQLHGGELRAGPSPDGGFVVRATLPASPGSGSGGSAAPPSTPGAVA